MPRNFSIHPQEKAFVPTFGQNNELCSLAFPITGKEAVLDGFISFIFSDLSHLFNIDGVRSDKNFSGMEEVRKNVLLVLLASLQEFNPGNVMDGGAQKRDRISTLIVVDNDFFLSLQKVPQ
jgi:hypothetical protein